MYIYFGGWNSTSSQVVEVIVSLNKFKITNNTLLILTARAGHEPAPAQAYAPGMSHDRLHIYKQNPQ